MNLIDQINARRKAIGREVKDLAILLAMNPSNIYRILSSKKDIRGSTLDGFADALNAKWMLVPKHLIPEVERLISGKTVGLDDTPSSVDLLFGDDRG